MKKTLAQLKRDLAVGTKVTQIAKGEDITDKNLNVERWVVKKQGDGVCLNTDKEATDGSWLYFPYASQVDYEDNIVSFYDIGMRKLTKEELNFIANAPSKRPENAEKVLADAFSDGSMMYWQDKAYYEQANKKYLWALHTDKDGDYIVEDKKARGAFAFTYKIG